MSEHASQFMLDNIRIRSNKSVQETFESLLPYTAVCMVYVEIIKCSMREVTL